MQIFTVKSKFLNGAFDQNTYVIEKDNQVVVIDAGAEVEDLKRVVGNKKVLAVCLTHLHFDHSYNLEEYIKTFDCDVYLLKGYEDYLLDSTKNVSQYFGIKITHKIQKSHIKYYAENLEIGKFNFNIISVPGHSKDSVCLLVENNLFCGDTLFYEGVGRTDLYGGDAEELRNSLRLIKKLDFEMAYAGHFEPFSKPHALREISHYI